MNKAYQQEQYGEHFRNKSKRRMAYEGFVRSFKSDAKLMVAGLVNQGLFIPVISMSNEHPNKHLAGKTNLPGGKVEMGETYSRAMAREMEEETGLKTHAADWHIFACYEYLDDGAHNIIYFLRTDITRSAPKGMDRICSTREMGHNVSVIDWRKLAYGSGFNIMANLRWLIPLGMYVDRKRPFDIPYFREDLRKVSIEAHNPMFLLDC